MTIKRFHTFSRQSSEKLSANRRKNYLPTVGKIICQSSENHCETDDPEKKEQNISMSELNPKRLLKGETPRLIDVWQKSLVAKL